MAIVSSQARKEERIGHAHRNVTKFEESGARRSSANGTGCTQCGRPHKCLMSVPMHVTYGCWKMANMHRPGFKDLVKVTIDSVAASSFEDRRIDSVTASSEDRIIDSVAAPFEDRIINPKAALLSGSSLLEGEV